MESTRTVHDWNDYIVVLDLLMCLLVLLLLSFFAVEYDSDRGLGELDFALVEFAEIGTADIEGAFFATSFTALVLQDNMFDAYEVARGGVRSIGNFQSVKELNEIHVLEGGRIVVVYESGTSSVLSAVVRSLSRFDIRMGIARTVDEE